MPVRDVTETQCSFRVNANYDPHNSVFTNPTSRSMHQLPLELIYGIVFQASLNSSLYSLCLTTKAAYQVAVKELYRNIGDEQNEIVHFKLLTTLVHRNPSLASLIHTYAISSVAEPPNQDLISDRTFESKSPKIWALLPRAFSHMHNLKRLYFRRESGPSAFWILRDTSFQLEELHWDCPEEGMAIDRFLDGQRDLVSLFLREKQADAYLIETSSLHGLRSLAGGMSVLGTLLPGQSRITHIRWLFDTTTKVEDHPLWPVIAPELSRMTHVSLVECDSVRRRFPLKMVVGCFQSLVLLELRYLTKVSSADAYFYSRTC